MKIENNHLRLFVYGTLKRGFCNYDRFCTQAISIEPAKTWGRLYHLPAGFPALEVPDSSILAIGTTDPLADTQTQNTIELPVNTIIRPEDDWGVVHGELITFANPVFDLPPIDQFEEFVPNGNSMYQRVLVMVECQGCFFSCWTYHGLNHILRDGLRLLDGYWEQQNSANLD